MKKEPRICRGFFLIRFGALSGSRGNGRFVTGQPNTASPALAGIWGARCSFPTRIGTGWGRFGHDADCGREGGTLRACSNSTPSNVDVIVRRWQDWTGELATRESDGAAYDELSVTGETSGKGVSSDESLSLEPAAASSWVRKLRQASALPASAWLARSLMRARISDPNLLEPAKCRSPI